MNLLIDRSGNFSLVLIVVFFFFAIFEAKEGEIEFVRLSLQQREKIFCSETIDHSKN